MKPELRALGPLKKSARLQRAWQRCRFESARAALQLFHAVCALPQPGGDGDDRLFTSLGQAVGRLELILLPAERRFALPSPDRPGPQVCPQTGCLLWPEQAGELPPGQVLRVRRAALAADVDGGRAELVVASSAGEGPPGYALDAPAPGLLTKLLAGKDDVGRFLERVAERGDASLETAVQACRENLAAARDVWRLEVRDALLAALAVCARLPAGLSNVAEALELDVLPAGDSWPVPEQRDEPARVFDASFGSLWLEHSERARGQIIEVQQLGVRRRQGGPLLLPGRLRLSLGSRPSQIEAMLAQRCDAWPELSGLRARLGALRLLPLDQRDGLEGRSQAARVYSDLEAAGAPAERLALLRSELALLGMRPYPEPDQTFPLPELPDPGARLAADPSVPRGRLLTVERQAFLWKGCLLGEPRYVLSSGPEDGLQRALRIVAERTADLPPPGLSELQRQLAAFLLRAAAEALPEELVRRLLGLAEVLPAEHAELGAALVDQLRMRGLEVLPPPPELAGTSQAGSDPEGCEPRGQEFSALPRGQVLRVLRAGYRYRAVLLRPAEVILSRGPCPPLLAGWRRLLSEAPPAVAARLQAKQPSPEPSDDLQLLPILLDLVDLLEDGETRAALEGLLAEAGVEFIPALQAVSFPLQRVAEPGIEANGQPAPEPEAQLLSIEQRGYRWGERRRSARFRVSLGPSDPLVPVAFHLLSGQPLELLDARGAPLSLRAPLPDGCRALARAWLQRPPPRAPEAGALFLHQLWLRLGSTCDAAWAGQIAFQLSHLGARLLPSQPGEPVPGALGDGLERRYDAEVPEGCCIGPYKPGLVWQGRWLQPVQGVISLGPPSPVLQRLRSLRAELEGQPEPRLRSRLLAALGTSLAELEQLPRTAHSEWPGALALVRLLDACDASGEPCDAPRHPELARRICAELQLLGARVDAVEAGASFVPQADGFVRTARPVFDQREGTVLAVASRAVFFAEAAFRPTTELWVGAGQRPHVLALLERFALEARMAGVEDEALDALLNQARRPDAHALHVRVIEAVNLLYQWSVAGRPFPRGTHFMAEFLHGVLAPLGYSMLAIEAGAELASFGNRWCEPRFVHKPGAEGHTIVRVLRPAFRDEAGEVVQRALVEVAR